MTINAYRNVHLLLLSLILATLAFAWNQRYLQGTDNEMWTKAREIYKEAHEDSGRPFLPLTTTTSDFRVYNLPRDIHVLASEPKLQGGGAMYVGHTTTRLGKPATYYATRVGPRGLGMRMGLMGTLDDSPWEREVLALWKYSDHRVKLLAVDTHAFTGALYPMVRLSHIIPLEKVREIL
ncbi:uncharacterized protein UTRI_10429 [Ustilago trichophora]|uniref:Uncharacterized protein n=1 Tax=Ustilago trichophora TaxID=86804 RepID=A0A5C3E9N5_9BASI|nr:uncharacterized protein UTRI_10429 [Ustilago trichophora]